MSFQRKYPAPQSDPRSHRALRTTTPLLGASAAAYARLGFTVFPTHWPIHKGQETFCSCGAIKCENIGKHPGDDTARDRKGEGGLYTATSNLATVQKLWENNPLSGIGIRTGPKAEEGEPEAGSGYFVLDVDNGYDAKGRYKDGDYELEVLQDVIGRLPETWTCVSGSGGKHLYFKDPGGDWIVSNRGSLTVPVPEGWDNEAFLDKTGKRLVFRALQIRGAGGYVLAPPSMHKSGRDYTWDADLKPGAMECADAPEALLSIVVRKKGGRPHDDTVPEEGFPPMDERLRRAKACLAKMPGAVSGQGGHTVTFVTALTMVRGFALPPGAAFDLLLEWNKTCTPPWEHEDLARKVEEVVVSGQAAYGYCFRDDTLRAVEREVNPLKLINQREAALAETKADQEADIVSRNNLAEALAEEVEAFAEEGGGGPAGPPGRGTYGDGSGPIFFNFQHGDETEVARAVIAMLQENGRHVFFEEFFFWWYDPATGIWDKMDPKWMKGQIQRFAHSQVGDKAVLKMSSSFVNGALLCMINEFQSMPTGFSFEKAAKGITFRNGFLRIDSNSATKYCAVTLTEYSPHHLSRHRIDVDWSETPMDAPKLRRFMDALFHDVKDPVEKQKRLDLIQEFMGVTVAGMATDYQMALFLRGNGNNGKSALLEVVFSLFNKKDVAAVPPAKWGQQFQARGLVGAAVNICDDLSAGDMHADNLASFKIITTGGPHHLDIKHGEPGMFRFKGACWLAMNVPFKVTDSQEAFFRRCAILPLTADFGKRKDLCIPNAGKILAEEEPAQIVQWAIAGLVRLVRNGSYTIPESSQKEVVKWKEDSDVVYSFLTQMSDAEFKPLNEPAGILVGKFYELFVTYIKDNCSEKDMLSKNMLGRRLTATGLTEKRHTIKGDVYFANETLVNLRAARKRDVGDEDAAYHKEVAEAPKDRPRILSSVAPSKETIP